MARTLGRLTALAVSRTTTPGMYADGGGLYLQVTGAGAKSWIFRFTLRGRAREMGLGSLTTISLAEARTRAAECRRLCHDGIDPIEARRARHDQLSLETARAMTFRQCASAYIEAHRAGWRNAKHAAQWSATLETYAGPVFGDVPVHLVDVALVMKALDPIWAAKPETAGRVRGRVEAVLDWATVRGYRTGENPARWKGHLQKLLPNRAKVRRVQHHAALPYPAVSEFLERLRAQDGIAARALEFTILTAARTGEVISARWDEFDPDQRVWTVPAERMKGHREHRVPLSSPALKVVEQMRAARQVEFVFPGGKAGRPLSNMAMLKLLDRMGCGDLTVHGFRSAFRNWAAECTNVPREVCEMALAHTIGSKVEAAYRRGDLFEKRRELMAAWAEFCGGAANAR